MSVPEAAQRALLENIRQLIKYDNSLASNIRESIEEIQLDLGFLNSLIKDLSRYNLESDYLKTVLMRVRGIINEVEDAVDNYIVSASGQRKSRIFISRTKREAMKQIAHVAQKLKKTNEENIRSASELMQYQAISQYNRPARIFNHEAPMVEEDHVIGFDDPAEQVIRLLVEGPENLEVISIAGMAGLGKTTLAKMVYKNPRVDYHYMIRAFVYISREYDKAEVLLRILGSFDRINDEIRNMTAYSLQEHLYKALRGKQYLIVLDNLCELKDWDALKDAFPRNNDRRCRVLITTTNGRLAERANPGNPNSLYMLNLLSPRDSERLLCWRVFHKDVFPDEFLSYVHQIVRRCEGLPLAIVVIAGILLNQRDIVAWWEEVSRSVNDYMTQELRGYNKGVTNMMYEHLPNFLKPCFLYLGIFPENFDIPVWKLERLWISEGLIETDRGNISLEDIADAYLDELIARNLVVVAKRRSNGKVKTCRIHNTLREFCKNEAIEENLYQEIHKNKMNSFLSENPSLDSHRRLFINDPCIMDYMSGPVSGKHVRSFLTFQKESLHVQPRQASCILKAFKLLKVLEAQSLTFPQLPLDLITNLILLKYLAISSNTSIIPSSISRMWNLQTLIISTLSRTIAIETDLWKMPQFRHLHANSPASFPSPGTKNQKSKEYGSESNVQTLCTITPESCTREMLHQTPLLEKLGIRGNIAVIFEPSGIFSEFSKLESLENLKLEMDDGDNILGSLPAAQHFPRRLTKLTLMNTRLKWNQMSTLGRLENLGVLKLKEFAFAGESWNTEEGGFGRLKNLFIGETDLRVWTEASEKHFPILHTLQLNRCSTLEGLPKGLEVINSLKYLVLRYSSSKVALEGRDLVRNPRNILELSVYPPEF